MSVGILACRPLRVNGRCPNRRRSRPICRDNRAISEPVRASRSGHKSTQQVTARSPGLFNLARGPLS